MTATDLTAILRNATVVDIASDSITVRFSFGTALDADSPPCETTDGFEMTSPDPQESVRRRKRFYDDAFKRFWFEAYWDRTCSKTTAREVFEKKARTMKGKLPKEAAEFLIQQAIDDRRRFEPTDAWSWRKNLHATTWLRQERWNDEPTTSGSSRNGKQDRAMQIFKENYLDTGLVK